MHWFHAFYWNIIFFFLFHRQEQQVIFALPYLIVIYSSWIPNQILSTTGKILISGHFSHTNKSIYKIRRGKSREKLWKAERRIKKEKIKDKAKGKIEIKKVTIKNCCTGKSKSGQKERKLIKNVISLRSFSYLLISLILSFHFILFFLSFFSLFTWTDFPLDFPFTLLFNTTLDIFPPIRFLVFSLLFFLPRQRKCSHYHYCYFCYWYCCFFDVLSKLLLL